MVLTFLDQNSPCGNQYFREHPNSRGILGCLIDAIAKFGFKDLTNLRPEDCLKVRLYPLVFEQGLIS